MRPTPRQPAISLYAVEKAARVLRPFVRIYFPYHGLSEADFLQFFPPLVCVEASVYQIDDAYEKNIGKGAFDPAPMDMLFDYIERKDLLDAEIKKELDNAVGYYRLEHAMCGGEPFTHQDVIQASRYRCYDFRVLHRLMFRMREQPYDEGALEVFRVGEILGELEDDLRSYPEDVERNVFNTYHMLVRLHGVEARAVLRQYVDDLNAELAAQRPHYPELVGLWEAYRKSSPVPEVPEPILT